MYAVEQKYYGHRARELKPSFSTALKLGVYSASGSGHKRVSKVSAQHVS